MRHYQVKFVDQNQVKYGICDEYSDEAKACAKKGLILVTDAVLPVSYALKEEQLTDIEMDMGHWCPIQMKYIDLDEFHQFVNSEFEKAQQISDNLPDGVHIGSLFGIGVGDGTAWYVVTKVNKKTAKVEWRGFCADRWTDSYLGYGRTVALDYVNHYIRRIKAAKQLFGAKNVT